MGFYSPGLGSLKRTVRFLRDVTQLSSFPASPRDRSWAGRRGQLAASAPVGRAEPLLMVNWTHPRPLSCNNELLNSSRLLCCSHRSNKASWAGSSRGVSLSLCHCVTEEGTAPSVLVLRQMPGAAPCLGQSCVPKGRLGLCGGGAPPAPHPSARPRSAFSEHSPCSGLSVTLLPSLSPQSGARKPGTK